MLGLGAAAAIASPNAAEASSTASSRDSSIGRTCTPRTTIAVYVYQTSMRVLRSCRVARCAPSFYTESQVILIT